MSAGLPGLGLGGLFFIFSALLAPFFELGKMLRGRSSVGAWQLVGRQFAQAVAMIVAIDLTIRLIYLGLSTTGLGDAPRADTGTVLPLTLIGITSVLLVAVVGMAKMAELGIRIRTAELPRVPEALPMPTPLRTFATVGIVTLAWFALLAGGASELSPLVKPRENRTAEQHVKRAQGSPSSPVNPAGRLAAVPSTAPLLHSSWRQKPVGSAGHEGNRNDAAGTASPSPSPSPEESSDAGPALRPSVQALPPATPAPPPERPPAPTAPAAVGAPSHTAGLGNSRPDAAQPPDTGPPEGAGPLESLPGPGNPGPPPHAGPG